MQQRLAWVLKSFMYSQYAHTLEREQKKELVKMPQCSGSFLYNDFDVNVHIKTGFYAPKGTLGGI